MKSVVEVSSHAVMILLMTFKLIINLIIIYSNIIMIDKWFNTIFIPHNNIYFV